MQLFAYVILLACQWCERVDGTRDVDEKELEYLSHHLKDHECRQLIEALHAPELNLDVIPDGSLTDVNMTCIALLNRWNAAESRGQTFSKLVHRLKELDQSDLADKVSRTVFSDLTANLHLNLEKAESSGGEEFISLHKPVSGNDREKGHIPEFDGRQEEDSWKLQLPNWSIGQSVLFVVSSMFIVGLFGFWFFHCVPDCIRGLCDICRRNPRKNRDEAAQMLLNEMDDADA